MARKLVIVNNGLRNLSGPYYETSVSIADAARKLGYKPILAAHVSCSGDIIPDWLEFYPLFTTDHWMLEPPWPAPDLRGIRGDALAMMRTPLESVLCGRQTIGEYLRARLEPLEFAEEVQPALFPPPPPPAPAPGVHRPSWTTRLKGAGKGWIPPLLLPAIRELYGLARQVMHFGRWLHDRRAAPWAAAKAAAHAVLPPRIHVALIGRSSLPPCPAPTTPAALAAAEVPPQRPDSALTPDQTLPAGLERIQAGAEFDYMRTYQRDLERLLCLTGVDRNDHVFMPTAHARELLAVQRLVGSLEGIDLPTFHLEFRHTLDRANHLACRKGEHLYTTSHRVYFDHFRLQPHHPWIRLYTDTSELTEEFSHFSGLCFGTLPIPVRTNFLVQHTYRPSEPLCLAFFGDVREEKGFFLLPDLVEDLWDEYLLTGKVRFLIQATHKNAEGEKRSHAALLRLKELNHKHVILVGQDGPLDPEEYYELFSQADVLLCPYCPHAYRNRSSGTFAEALTSGIPTVVPEGTWLARQQPADSGETFADTESFAQAVRYLCDHYPHYLKNARAHRDRWLAFHTPLNLVRRLLDPEVARCACTPQAEAG